MSRILGIDPTAVYSALQIQRGEAPAIGTRGWDEKGNEYVLASVSATVAVGDIAFFSPLTWAATLLSTSVDAVNQIYGTAKAGMTSGQRGWFQIWGVGKIGTTEAVAVGATVVATATAGKVNDAALTDLFPIHGVTILSDPGGAGLADCFLCYPRSNFEVHA